MSDKDLERFISLTLGEDKDEFDSFILEKDTLTYKGQVRRMSRDGKLDCRPSSMNQSRPFWLFLKKNLAYRYAVDHSYSEFLSTYDKNNPKDIQYMKILQQKAHEKVRSECWTINTYNTIERAKLLDLTSRDKRLKIRNNLSKYKNPVKYPDDVKTGQEFALVTYSNEGDTCEEYINICFPSDLKYRYSTNDDDYNLSQILFNYVFKDYDGWYVGEIPTISGVLFHEEIMLMEPSKKIKYIGQDTFMYDRIESILKRCIPNLNILDCFQKVKDAFRLNKMACLIRKGKEECYRLEELADMNVVSKNEFEIIIRELDKGISIIYLE